MRTPSRLRSSRKKNWSTQGPRGAKDLKNEDWPPDLEQFLRDIIVDVKETIRK